MIIRKEHALILQELWKDKGAEGESLQPEKMNEDAVEELIVGGLIRKAAPSKWLLTYNGTQLLEALMSLTTKKASEGEQLLFDTACMAGKLSFFGKRNNKSSGCCI